MSTPHRLNYRMTRREMLTMCRNGFGGVALLGLMGSSAFGNMIAQGSRPETNPLHPRPGGLIPKARSIIFLYMDGGVSQVDSFDPKPRLAKENGENPHDKFSVDATQFNSIGKILKSPWDFHRYGESGIEVSDLFPHVYRTWHRLLRGPFLRQWRRLRVPICCFPAIHSSFGSFRVHAPQTRREGQAGVSADRVGRGP